MEGFKIEVILNSLKDLQDGMYTSLYATDCTCIYIYIYIYTKGLVVNFFLHRKAAERNNIISRMYEKKTT